MSTTFLGFQIVQSALSAMQEAVDVAGQNVANASTPGYAQERAVLVSQPNAVQAGTGGPVLNGVVGAGVNVAEVQRVTEGYLNSSVRNAQSAASYQGAVVQFLGNAQSLYNEPTSNGLSSTMQKFYTDLSTLSQNPQSSASRAVVAQDAASVVNQLNTLASGLSQLSSGVTTDLGTQVSQVNQQLGQIANLNQQIAAAQINHVSANSLLDQRSQILNQLSKSMAITVGTDSAGNVQVTDSATGAVLVTGQQAGSLSVSGNTVTETAAGATTAATANITQGQIGADLVLLGGAVPTSNVPAYAGALAPVGSTNYSQSLQSGLDQVASAFAGEINTLQQAGYNLNASGTPTSAAAVPFFVNGSASTAATLVTTGITAANIAVNSAILAAPNLIAAAQSAQAGDGSNALAMSDWGQSTAPSSAVALYSGQISAIGVQVASAQSSQTTGQSLLAQAQKMQQSVSGVSVNQEFANLTQYQDVYTAAAKALGAMQTMLQSLLSVVN